MNAHQLPVTRRGYTRRMPRLSLSVLSALLAVTLPCAAGAQTPVRVEFWHAMNGVQGEIAAYARDFNRSQNRYEVVPVAQGSYRDLLPKLETALKTGKAPALAQLEFTQFPALAQAGQLTDLSGFVDDLPAALRSDIYPAVWKAGELGGKNFGLPWNVSVPVLMYNAGVLRSSPAGWTWTALEAAARKMATRSRRPLVVTAEAWTFEANVMSRGGSLASAGRPALNSPEALEALTQLTRMTQGGLAQYRSLTDVAGAAFDFARGQNVLVLASVANWNDARKIPLLSVGVAPFPCEKASACTVPLGGGTLVVPKGTPAAERAGAQAFWQYLMAPERLADWVRATAYVSPRRSATPLLEGWYAKNPQIRAAHAQIGRAAPRATTPDSGEWVPLVERAIEQAVGGKMTPKAALDAAQKAAK